MSILMKNLQSAARATNSARNIALLIKEYVNCDTKDTELNKVIGVDIETGETVELMMTKHEDNGNNKRRDIFAMKNGTANEKIAVGGTVLFQSARLLGESGGIKRYRANWTDGLIRGFKRDENDGIIRDKDKNPVLDGIVNVGYARVLPLRMSRDNTKHTQAVEILVPQAAEAVTGLADLKDRLTKILSKPMGQPFGLIRIADTKEHGMLTRGVAKRQNQSAADAVNDFFANVPVGQQLAAALAEGVPADHICEVIPGAKFFFGPKSVEAELAKDEANKDKPEDKQRPTAASAYTAQTMKRKTKEGVEYNMPIQGYTQSVIALANVGKGDEAGLIAANITPTTSRPELKLRNEIVTKNIAFAGKVLEDDNTEELEPTEEAVAGANKTLAA